MIKTKSQDEALEFLKTKLDKAYGKAMALKIIEGMGKRKVSFRANALKSDAEKIETALKDAGLDHEKPKFYGDAFYLTDAPLAKLRELSIYKDGHIYVQSLSSMLPALVLEPRPGEDILDMCAAPGGKTTQLAALTGGGAFVTACEMNKIRAEKLKYNIKLQGAGSALVMEQDARELSDFFSFDSVLLDAPCTGCGTFDLKNPKSFKGFGDLLLKKTTKLQRALLKKAVTLLKSGHSMVYSTCSVLPEENEDIISEALSGGVYAEPVDMERFEELPLLETKIPGTLCVRPTELFEGFFIARLRKA